MSNIISSRILSSLVIIASFSVSMTSCQGQANKANAPFAQEKQKGIHVFGRIDSTSFSPLANLNMNWVTLVPWGYQADFDSQEVGHHRGDSTQMRRRDSSWVERIKMAQADGFKVFVKPHAVSYTHLTLPTKA